MSERPLLSAEELAVLWELGSSRDAQDKFLRLLATIDARDARIADLEEEVAGEQETNRRLREEILSRDAEIAELVEEFTPAYEKVRDLAAGLQAESDQLKREVEALQEPRSEV